MAFIAFMACWANLAATAFKVYMPPSAFMAFLAVAFLTVVLTERVVRHS